MEQYHNYRGFACNVRKNSWLFQAFGEATWDESVILQSNGHSNENSAISELENEIDNWFLKNNNAKG